MPRIFVSHSHHDDHVGLPLVADLRARLGKDAVWYDAAGGLHGGDRWWRKIVSEITARDTFIVILSPDAVASPWVQREMELAYYLQDKPGRRLLPLRYRPCELSADWELIQSLPISDPAADPEAYATQLATLFNELLDSSGITTTQSGTGPTLSASRQGAGSKQARADSRQYANRGPFARIVGGVRLLLCIVVLILYWLLIGYTTPSIFPETILRISGSDYLVARLRGSDNKTELLKALVVLVSLTADWYLVGTLLSHFQVPDVFSLPYGLVSNILGSIAAAVLLLLVILYALLSMVGWRYINVVNIRKTLEVVLVIMLLMFASQIRVFGATYLYFPVVAGVTTLSLFLYGLISLGGSQSGDGARGYSAKFEERLQRQIMDRKRSEEYFNNRRRQDLS